MSYDIYLGINTGQEMHDIVDVGNHTSNTANMWQKALGYSLGDLHGTIAGDAVKDLRKAIADMEDSRNEYLPMSPANGWGTYETALKYLKDVLEACAQHPACTIIISC